MILWPVVINYKGDDELTFILNEYEWASDNDVNFHSHSNDDQLIDSNGVVFKLLYNDNKNTVEIKKTKLSLTINEFESLIKNHMASLNQCCISKIHLKSFENGMLLVEHTNE